MKPPERPIVAENSNMDQACTAEPIADGSFERVQKKTLAEATALLRKHKDSGKGRIFRARFRTRSSMGKATPKFRDLVCRYDVVRHRKGGALPFDPSEKGLVMVYEMLNRKQKEKRIKDRAFAQILELKERLTRETKAKKQARIRKQLREQWERHIYPAQAAEKEDYKAIALDGLVSLRLDGVTYEITDTLPELELQIPEPEVQIPEQGQQGGW